MPISSFFANNMKLRAGTTTISVLSIHAGHHAHQALPHRQQNTPYPIPSVSITLTFQSKSATYPATETLRVVRLTSDRENSQKEGRLGGFCSLLLALSLSLFLWWCVCSLTSPYTRLLDPSPLFNSLRPRHCGGSACIQSARG